MRIERIITIGFLLALLLLGDVGFLTYQNSKEIIESGNLLAHTDRVLYETESILSKINTHVSETRGYIISSNKKFLEASNQAREEVRREIGQLRALLSGDVRQKERIDTLELVLAERFAVSDSQISRVQHGQRAEAEKYIAGGMALVLMDRTRCPVAV